MCGEKCIFEIPNLKLIFFLKGNALQNSIAQLTLLNTSNGDVNGLNPSTLLLQLLYIITKQFFFLTTNISN